MIGGFRHRVQVQSDSGTSDDAGGRTVSWTTDFTTWASIEPAGGSEVLQANHLQARITHKITLRCRSDITTDHRILFGSRVFNVRRVLTVAERSRFTELLAEEGSAV